jgi:hypothetical protein
MKKQMGKWETGCVKKIISLFFILLLGVATPTQADYQQAQSFSLPEEGNDPWVTQLVFDLSDYSGDLSQIKDWTISFSHAVLTSQMIIHNEGVIEDNTIYAGDYEADLTYRLGITAAGQTVSDGNARTIIDPPVYYQVENDVSLNLGETKTFEQVGTTEFEFQWTSEGAILSSFLDGNFLILDFNYRGLSGDLAFDIPDGMTKGFRTVSLAGDIVLSFAEPVSGTPEPATFLIFGTAAVIGLPVVRRMRRK